MTTRVAKAGDVVIYCQEWSRAFPTREQAEAFLDTLSPALCGGPHLLADVVACRGCGQPGISQPETVEFDHVRLPSTGLALLNSGSCYGCLAVALRKG